MRKFIFAMLMSGLMSTTALANDGQVLEIKNFIGTIEWSNGPELEADIVRENDTLDLTMSDNKLVVDGGLEEVDTTNCRGYSGKYSFSWSWGKKEDGKKSQGRFGGYKDLDEFPKLKLTIPADVDVIINESIPFTYGAPDVGSLSSETRGCGDIEIGNAQDFIKIKSSGSGDFTAANVPEAEISLRGSGDIELGDIDSLVLNLSGSGDGSVVSAGSAEISIKGSGDVEIGDVSGDLFADSHGSGDMNFGSVRGDLAYKGRGSGDFYADSAYGRVSLELKGSGDAEIDAGDVSELYITASGSSNVEFGGTAATANLRVSGAADIEVERVTGELVQSDSGAADIDVKHTK